MTTRERSAWTVDRVAGMAWMGAPSLALDSRRLPQAAAWRQTTGNGIGTLSLARFDGLRWMVDEVVDAFGAHASFVIDGEGRPAVVYVDLDQSSVMLAHAAEPGGEWAIETVAEGVHGLLAGGPSLAHDGDGRPQVAYATDGGVMIAARTVAGVWETDPVVEVIEPANDLALAIDGSGVRHVLQRTIFSNALILHSDQGGSWSASAVPWGDDPDAGFLGDRPCLAVDPDGRPHVAYWTRVGVCHATADDDGEWQITVAIPDEAAGPNPAISVDSHGHPVIACVNPAGGNIELARLSANGWRSETIAAGSKFHDTAGWVSMVVDDFGVLHLAVSHDESGELMWIRSNRGPITKPLRLTAFRDMPLTGHSIAEGASDPDGDDLAVSTRPVRKPSHGKVTIRSGGGFTYTPHRGYLGHDEFRYEVTDHTGLNAIGGVEIEVVVPVLIRVAQRPLADKRRGSTIRLSLRKGPLHGIKATLQRKRRGRWHDIRSGPAGQLAKLLAPIGDEWTQGPFRVELRPPGDGEVLCLSEEFSLPPKRGVELVVSGDLTGLPTLKRPPEPTPEPQPQPTPVPVFDPAAGLWGTWPSKRNKPPLARGSQGDAVRYLQGVLLHRTKGKVTVDGIYGVDTSRRVRELQRREQIRVDGEIGEETWPVIDRLARKDPVPVFDPVAGLWGTWPSKRNKPPLARGSQGDAVRYLQGVLLHRTKGNITVDGVYGVNTANRVRELQRQEKIRVDGEVGKGTWPVIDRLATR